MASIEELQLLNYVISSKDWGRVEDLGINEGHFIVHKDAYNFIRSFKERSGGVPTAETVLNDFSNFDIVELEDIDHVANTLKQEAMYRDIRPHLIEATKDLGQRKVTEGLQKLHDETARILKSSGQTDRGYSYRDNAEERLATYDSKHGRKIDEISGYTLGLKPLDVAVNGLEYQEGAVDYLLAFAPTNMGKTLLSSFMMAAGWANYDNDYPAYFALEQRATEIAHNWDNTLAKVSRFALTRGLMSNEKRDMYAHYVDILKAKQKDMMIYDLKANGGKPYTLDNIRRILEREGHNRWTLDQLSKVRLSNTFGGSSDLRQRLFDVSAGVRELILDTGKPAVVVAQANREALKKIKKDITETVDAGDIGEAFSIVQDASKGISIVKVNNQDFKVTVIKNRENESGQTFIVRYDFETGLVAVLDDALGEEYF